MDIEAFKAIEFVINSLIMILISLLVSFTLYIYMSFINMKLFRQAGIEGWKAWVPIYNTCLQYKIAGYPMWYLFVAIAINFIPIVGSIIAILILAVLRYQYAIAFTRNKTIGILSIFFGIITYSVLAFSNTYNHGYIIPKKLLNEYI